MPLSNHPTVRILVKINLMIGQFFRNSMPSMTPRLFLHPIAAIAAEGSIETVSERLSCQDPLRKSRVYVAEGSGATGKNVLIP